MIGGQIEVEIYTSSHRICGKVNTGALGLFSYLNRPTESYLEIEQGGIIPLHQITQPEESCGEFWLIKKEIIAALVHSRSLLGPSSAVRAGYTKPIPHLVRVHIAGYELCGYIQTSGRFNFGAFMFEGENTFVPLFDAQLSALLFPRVQANAPALVFNRSMVHAISLLPRERNR
jgi:hypothetical protein